MKRDFAPNRFLLTVSFVLVICTLSVLGYFLNQKLTHEEKVISNELIGNEYIHNHLAGFLESVQRHRGLTTTYLSGDASFKEHCLAKQVEIDAEVRNADAFELSYGGRLGTTEKWKRIKTRWQDLKARVFSLSAEENLSEHKELIRQTLAFFSYVADASGLSLDSYLTTYYLTRLTTANLPYLSEYLGQIRAIGTKAASLRAISESDKKEVFFLLGKVEAGNEEVKRNVDIIIKESPELKEALKKYLGDGQTSLSEFLEMAQTKITGAPAIDIDPLVYFNAATKAIHSQFMSLGASAHFLEEFLTQRFNQVKQVKFRLQVILTASFILLALIFLFLQGKLKLRDIYSQELQSQNIILDSLLKAIPFGIDIVDEAGNTLYINQKLKAMVGDNALGKKCWELYKDDKTRCAGCPLSQDITMGEVKSLEVSGVLGGKTVLIDHVGLLYQGKKACLEIFQDITQRKILEKELRSSYELLQNKTRDLEKFQQVMVGRELKMAEIKNEIEALKKELAANKKDENQA